MKNKYIILAMASMLSLSSCIKGLFGEKDEEGYWLVQAEKSSETTTAFDNSYFGLYKGIIIGPKSAGTAKMEINHGNDEAKVFITIGNKTDVLTYTKAYISENNQRSNEYTAPTPLPSITDPRIYADITFEGAFSSTNIIISSYERTPDSYDKRSNEVYCYVHSIHIEGHDNLTMFLLKETSDNVVNVYEGTCNDKNGNQGKLMFMYSKYDGHAFLRGESEGMNIDFYPPRWFDNRHSEEGSYEINDIYYKYVIKYEVSDGYWGGTWKTTWTGGLNNGTFSCNVPLEKGK